MEGVKKLAFVFVQSLYLNVKYGIGIDYDIIGFFDVRGDLSLLAFLICAIFPIT